MFHTDDRRCVFIGCFILLSHLVAEVPAPSSPTEKDAAFVHATFQQTFLFTYTKQEDGICTDLTIYRNLLEPFLDASESHLPEICTLEESHAGITGQLVISDIEELGRNIFVNITLIYDYKHSIEQCKSEVQAEFELDDAAVTSPFRRVFSPLQCPGIYTTKGAHLVHSGYICRDPNQIRAQVLPGGHTKPIEVCEFCPLGKEKLPGSNTCTECRQGYYKDKEVAALCDPCPAGYVTRVNGSTSRYDCNLRACNPGSYADVSHRGICTVCPLGSYQPYKWQEQCLPCPAEMTTYVRGATTLDRCIFDCRPGQQYSHTTRACEPCPVGYYNDDHDPSRYRCTLCPIDYITADTGATSARDCSVRNCTVLGQYLDKGNNICRDCPRGQWQNQKWQTSCNDCNAGLITKHIGTAHPEQCQEPMEPQAAAGFQSNDMVVIAMLGVLVGLVVGNLLIVGYCLCSRKHHQASIPISPSTTDPEGAWKATDSGDSWHYEDIDLYDVIRPDATLPNNSGAATNANNNNNNNNNNDNDNQPMTSSQSSQLPSSFKVTQPGSALSAARTLSAAVLEASAPGSSREDYDAIVYTEQRKYAVACSAGQKDMEDLQVETLAVGGGAGVGTADDECLDDDSVEYDDIANTCPVYQNVGGSGDAEGASAARVWLTSRREILY